MSRKTELAKNTAILTVGKLCTQCISFFLLPLYTAILSTEEYGTFDLLVTYGAPRQKTGLYPPRDSPGPPGQSPPQVFHLCRSGIPFLPARIESTWSFLSCVLFVFCVLVSAFILPSLYHALRGLGIGGESVFFYGNTA